MLVYWSKLRFSQFPFVSTSTRTRHSRRQSLGWYYCLARTRLLQEPIFVVILLSSADSSTPRPNLCGNLRGNYNSEGPSRASPVFRLNDCTVLGGSLGISKVLRARSRRSSRVTNLFIFQNQQANSRSVRITQTGTSAATA